MEMKNIKIDAVTVITFFEIIICTFVSYFLFKNSGQDYFVMYMLFMIFSIFFAYLSSVSNKKTVSKFFLILSIFTMSYLFCFRNQTGIDDRVYKNLFENVQGRSLLEFLKISDIEVGYKVLNYIIYHLTNGDYNICQFFFSFIPIALIEITLWKKRKEIDFPLALLFVYMTLYYFVMFAGLVRIFFAVSIVFYGFRYILSNEIKKYVFCVFIASLFHSSALFMLILLILFINDNFFYKHIKLLMIVLLVVVPVLLFLVSRYIVPLLGARYQGYTVSFKGSSSIFSFIDRLPFAVIGFFYLPVISKENMQTQKEYRLYVVLVLLTISINVASSWTDFGRIVYYTNCGITLLMAFLMKQEKIRYDNNGFFLSTIVVVIPYFYLMHTIFNNSYAWENLNNYSTFFN